MVCPPWPGDTVISRRTSRNPLRLPVTVYLPGFKVDLAPVERSEEAHALDGHFRGVVGFERQHHWLIERGQQKFQARHLRADHRALVGQRPGPRQQPLGLDAHFVRGEALRPVYECLQPVAEFRARRHRRAARLMANCSDGSRARASS